jgi:hypothetical protein
MGARVFLQGAVLALFGMLFLLMGLAVAFLGSAVSKGHRKWMSMMGGWLGRPSDEAMAPGTWLTIGVLTALMGAGLLFVGLNLLLRH